MGGVPASTLCCCAALVFHLCTYLSPAQVLAKPGGLQGPISGADNWYPSVFSGQGELPAGQQRRVLISAGMERLLKVDELFYQFSASFIYLLFWKDTEAAAQVYNATLSAAESGTCNRPCSNNVGSYQGAPCCDTLWLPTLNMANVAEFPSTIMRSSITLCGSQYEYVSWEVKVLATYYTAMTFQAFPFDKQYLVAHFATPVRNPGKRDAQVQYVPSASAVSEYFKVGGLENGDDVSGWQVDKTIVTEEQIPLAQLYVKRAGDLSQSLECQVNNSYMPGSETSSGMKDFLESTFPPMASEGYNFTRISVVIVVKRNSWYYIWTLLVPIFLNGIGGFSVYLFHPRDVDMRFQSLVTLFLALVALQFVVNQNLPASSYVLPTQTMIIATYFLFVTLTTEIFIASHLLKRRSELLELEKGKLAQQLKLKEKAASGHDKEQKLWTSVKSSLASRTAMGDGIRKASQSRQAAHGGMAVREQDGESQKGQQQPQITGQGNGERTSAGRAPEHPALRGSSSNLYPSQNADSQESVLEVGNDSKEAAQSDIGKQRMYGAITCLPWLSRRKRRQPHMDEVEEDYLVYRVRKADKWFAMLMAMLYLVTCIMVLAVPIVNQNKNYNNKIQQLTAAMDSANKTL